VKAARARASWCGGDNDGSGATLWQQVTKASPRAEAIVRARPPAGATDGNDALRAQDRQEERAEEREPSQEHGPGRGGGGSSKRDDTPGHRR